VTLSVVEGVGRDAAGGLTLVVPSSLRERPPPVASLLSSLTF
jgi:hypothetical protein